MPSPSYSTTASSLLMPSASAAAAKAASLGSMCGRSVAGSATPSMSQNCAPGMRAAAYSCLASLPAAAAAAVAEQVYDAAWYVLWLFPFLTVLVQMDALRPCIFVKRNGPL
jgi:hypothetical protein